MFVNIVVPIGSNKLAVKFALIDSFTASCTCRNLSKNTLFLMSGNVQLLTLRPSAKLKEGGFNICPLEMDKKLVQRSTRTGSNMLLPRVFLRIFGYLILLTVGSEGSEMKQVSSSFPSSPKFELRCLSSSRVQDFFPPPLMSFLQKALLSLYCSLTHPRSVFLSLCLLTNLYALGYA